MAKIDYPVIAPPRVDFPQPYVHREPLIDSSLIRSYWDSREKMNEDTEQRAESLFKTIAKDDFVPTNSIYLFKNFGVLHNVNEYGRKKLVEAEDRITEISKTVAERGAPSHFWANVEMKRLSQAVLRDISGGNYKKAEAFGKALSDANSTLEKTNLQPDELYRSVNRLETILKGFDEKNKRFDLELYEEKTGSIPGTEQLAFVRVLESPFDAAQKSAMHVHSSGYETDLAKEQARETLKQMGIDSEDEDYLVNVESENRDVQNAVKETLENHPEAVLRLLLTARAVELTKELEDKMNRDLPEEKKVKLLTFSEEDYISKLQDKGKIGKAMAAIYNYHKSSRTVKGGLGSGKSQVPRSYSDYDSGDVNTVATMEEGYGLPSKNKVFLSNKSKEKFDEGFVQLSEGFQRKVIVSDSKYGLKRLSSAKTAEGTFGLQLETGHNFSLTMGGLKTGDEEKLTSAKLDLESLKLAKEKLMNPNISNSEKEKIEPMFVQGLRQMNYAVEKYSDKALIIKSIAESKERPLTKSEYEYYQTMAEINDIYREFLKHHMNYDESRINRIAPSLK